MKFLLNFIYIVVFTLLIGISEAFGQIEFAVKDSLHPLHINTALFSADAGISADFNGDNIPDLAFYAFVNSVVSGNNELQLSILIATSPGVFSSPDVTTLTIDPGSNSDRKLLTNDYNGDGVADLCVIYTKFSGYTSITPYLNDGDGKFSKGTTQNIADVTDVISCDFNQDGNGDIIAASYSTSISIWMLQGNGTGGFSVVKTFSTKQKVLSLAYQDLNNDNFPELIVGGVESQIEIFEAIDWLNFKTSVIVANVACLPEMLRAGDFDNDGNMDLVLSQSGGLVLKNVYVLYGKGDLTFESQLISYSDTNDGVMSIAVGNFNGDDFDDFIVSCEGMTYVSFSNGDRTYLTKSYKLTVFWGRYTTCYDINMDGLDDIIRTENASYIATISFANSKIQNTINAPIATYAAYPTGFIGNADQNLGDELYITDADTLRIYKSDENDNINQLAEIYMGITPYETITGDFNNDNNPDVAYYKTLINAIYILNSNGPLSYEPVKTLTVSNKVNAIFSEDIDGDGFDDLIASIGSQNLINIYYSKGDDTFESPQTASTDGIATSIEVMDFNKDNKKDLLLGFYPTYNFNILINNGNKTFTKTVSQILPDNANPKSISSADFNGDGNMDIALSLNNQSSIKIYYGNGLNGFIQDTTILNFNGGKIEAVDFNNDNRIDLIAVGSDQNVFCLMVFENLGNGLFKEPQKYSLGSILSFTVSNINLDNKKDILVISYTGFGVLTNQSTINISPIPEINTFSPSSMYSGEKLTISGNYFADVNSVTIDDKEVAFQIIDNNTIEVIIPSDATSGFIQVSNSAGSFTSTVVLEVNISTNFISGTFKTCYVYPNPTSSEVFFEDVKGQLKVEVFNSHGMRLKVDFLSPYKTNSISLSTFPEGIYYLVVENLSSHMKDLTKIYKMD